MLREKRYTECVLFCLLSQCRHLYSENINADPIFIGRRCSQVIWSPAGSCKEHCISLDHLHIFNALKFYRKTDMGQLGVYTANYRIHKCCLSNCTLVISLPARRNCMHQTKWHRMHAASGPFT